MNKINPRTLAVVLGLLFVGIAWASEALGLSATQGPSTGKLLLGTAGLGLATIGALGRRAVTAYKSVALIVLNTVVLFIVLEGTLHILSWVRGSAPPITDTPTISFVGAGRENLPYFKTKSWSKNYWREYGQAWNEDTQTPHPFLVWKTAPYSGTTLNIDKRGLRTTPGSNCTPASLKIYALGGSTMWGTGVPDWSTIPALIQSSLATAPDGHPCVVNLGEQGYNSTQELLQLLFMLRDEAPPTAVIFYDGINDVFSAYQAGAVDLPQNFREIARRLGERGDAEWRELANSSRLFRLSQKLAKGSQLDTPRSETSDLELSKLASAIAENYSANLRMVEALGREFGFEALFVWQPFLLTESRSLTEEELSIRGVAEYVYPGLHQLYEKTELEVVKRLATNSRFTNISGLFSTESDLIFIDPFHVTEEANARIAASIMDQLLPRLVPENLSIPGATPAAPR